MGDPSSPEEFRVWVPAIVARQVEDRGRVETEVVVELVGPGDTFPTAVAHRDSAAVIKAVRVRVVALVGVALVESAVRTARRVSNEGRLVTRAATLVVIVSKPRKAVALGFTRLHLVAFRILGEAHAITIASSAILPLPAFTKGLLATAVICARIREKCAAELAVGSPGAFVALALRTARPLHTGAAARVVIAGVARPIACILAHGSVAVADKVGAEETGSAAPALVTNALLLGRRIDMAVGAACVLIARGAVPSAMALALKTSAVIFAHNLAMIARKG
eukprot:CAMPEP_0182878252 /NCGR_PEP_ID=MMETSP0034_2-20130328/15240_1 /TAXON_ID=156128 /ORGANISM="Nephroselmis pyriformis, Strain CCMP717" /LENGTH=278 /DNA_ID=CAMNT_0025011131 /DNA_START=509 /DNA_END=1346 /DNA_ORIENTATION=+